jgi:hypothetical protein
MTDDDLDRWLGDAMTPALNDLEAAVWRRVDRRVAEDRRLAMVGAWQGGALVVAALASLSWGVISAAASARPQTLAVFSPYLASAPSTRLIGPAG